jgi:hypothetical protein
VTTGSRTAVSGTHQRSVSVLCFAKVTPWTPVARNMVHANKRKILKMYSLEITTRANADMPKRIDINILKPKTNHRPHNQAKNQCS